MQSQEVQDYFSHVTSLPVDDVLSVGIETMQIMRPEISSELTQVLTHLDYCLKMYGDDVEKLKKCLLQA